MRKTRPQGCERVRRLPLRTERIDRQVSGSYEINNRRLLERGIDGRELRDESRTKAINNGNDGKADAGGDEAEFDRGGARLIGHELCNKLLHSSSCTKENPLLGSPRGQ